MKIMHRATILMLLCFILMGTYLTNCQRYNGKAITWDMQDKVLSILKTSFIINGNDEFKNLPYIQKALQDTYSGNWNVFISDLYQPQYEYLNNTMNNDFWLKWYYQNPYAPSNIYGIQRYQKDYLPTDQFSTCMASPQFGVGFSKQQQSIISNIVQAIDITTQNLSQMRDDLNQFVEKGIWNIAAVKSANRPCFRIYNQNKKYFLAHVNQHCYLGFLA